MKYGNLRYLLLLGLLCAGSIGIAVAEGDKNEVEFNFDEDPLGAAPQGWKVETTRPTGPDASWKVDTDESAPSGSQVLSVIKAEHASNAPFNICWTDEVRFKDGEIEVKVRGNQGVADQGGGPIWRVQDKDNYYIARYNPLESNFRLYFVKNGARKTLASKADIRIPAGEWFEIDIEHLGDHIICELNDETLLDVYDTTFMEEGGVGLWTKADALTSFDSVEIELRAGGDDEDNGDNGDNDDNDHNDHNDHDGDDEDDE